MTLMAIADTPHSIAFGSAIGIFFGFTPLYPLKTLLSIAAAWICRCNKDRGGDRSHPARCCDLGDAGNLCCRIPARLLDHATFTRPTRAFPSIWFARLFALARVFARGVANFLAGVRWLAFLGDPVSDHCLFSDAPADQPRQSNAKNRLKEERVVLNYLFSANGAIFTGSLGHRPRMGD